MREEATTQKGSTKRRDGSHQNPWITTPTTRQLQQTSPATATTTRTAYGDPGLELQQEQRPPASSTSSSCPTLSSHSPVTAWAAQPLPPPPPPATALAAAQPTPTQDLPQLGTHGQQGAQQWNQGQCSPLHTSMELPL